MIQVLRAVAAAGICCVLLAGPASAAIIGQTLVASGLSSPMYVTHAPGDPDRLFIVERSGAIRVWSHGAGLHATPFINIPGISTSGEGGLLGLAFHPDYNTPDTEGFGKFYVNATINLGISGAAFTNHIREYSVSENPNVANTSFRNVITYNQPQNNHNGGWIGFSPVDEYLYIMTGDGGGGNDSGTGHTSGTGNAQDITNNLLGKALRIDVNVGESTAPYLVPPTNPFVGVTGDDEIWSYGLRNPFRASFDRMTGDLWIGDVGQGAREEINFQPASSTGGENYGWRLREGTIATPSGGVGGDRPPGNVDPVYDYPRSGAFSGTVVTGGYVYRGPDPDLQGKYFFADSRNSFDASNDNFWMFDPANPYGTVTDIKSMLTPNTGAPAFPVSFGEDYHGHLYIVYLNGSVYRIATTMPGDFTRDGIVDILDYDLWKSTFGQTQRTLPLPADANLDRIVDAADYTIWRDNVTGSLGSGFGSQNVPEPSTFAIAAALLAWVGGIVLGRRRHRALAFAREPRKIHPTARDFVANR